MRPIDADALVEELKYKRRIDREGKKYSGLECAISKIKKMPTINSKTIVAREIFAEIDKLHIHVTNEFDAMNYEKLKNKYMKEGN